MRIDYLANHEHLISEVADLVYGQWFDLFSAGGTSKEDLRAIFVCRAVTDRLPLTLVALEGSNLVGTGSIKLSEPGTKPGLSPWLAGMYVKPELRGSGVGTLLVRALESKAVELGIETLYLSVGAAPGFYQRLGWVELERVTSYGIKQVLLMAKNLRPHPSALGANNSLKRTAVVGPR